MARITVEDCLTKENNRFALVQLAAKRTKQILGGAKALVHSTNKAVVTALREIADSRVRFMTPEEQSIADAEAAQEKENILEQVVAQAAATPSLDDVFKAKDEMDDEEEDIIADDDGDDDVDDDIDDEEEEEEGEDELSDDELSAQGEEAGSEEEEEVKQDSTSGPDRNGDGGVE